MSQTVAIKLSVPDDTGPFLFYQTALTPDSKNCWIAKIRASD